MEKIKLLRDKTGAGIVDCKKALTEANDDIDKAVEILRKKGISKAAKRDDRETNEGVIKLATSPDKKIGYMIEVNAETDFVALNEKFLSFCDTALRLVIEKGIDDLETLNAEQIDGLSVKDTLDNLSGVIGEKLNIKNISLIKSEGTVEAYSHMNGRIGVLVALDTAGQDEMAHDIALQIAASDPKYLLPENVPAEELDKEREIYRAQLIKEGKPENMLDKIIEGKVNKFYEDVCLVNQEFIKDDKRKVKQVLGDMKIEKFVRFSLNGKSRICG